MIAMQARVWDDPLGEQGWMRVVSTALENLDQDDIPEELGTKVASWAALATYLLHEHRPASGRVAEVLSYETAADAVSHLFPDADARLVAQYAVPFTNKNGNPVGPDAVWHVIEVIVQDDPLDTAIDAVEAAHPDWRVRKHNGGRGLDHRGFGHRRARFPVPDPRPGRAVRWGIQRGVRQRGDRGGEDPAAESEGERSVCTADPLRW